MDKKFWITVVVIAVVITGGYAVYENQQTTGAAIKIGVIAGTTGQYAPAGESYVKGFNLALEEWDKSHSPKFTAIIEDDGFTAQKGLSAYQKLRSLDKVDAYAVLSSFTIDAIYDQLHAEGKPVVLGFEQSKPAEDDNIFQVLPAAKPLQIALGRKIKEMGYSMPVAAVSNNTSVYQNFYDGFQEGFGSDVPKFEINSDVGTIRSQALAIIRAKPDVIAFYGAPKDTALLVKEIARIAGSQKPLFVFDQSIQSGIRDYQTVLGSSIDKLDGSLVSVSRNDFTSQFTRQFQAKYNQDPPFGSDMGYNSLMLLAKTYDSDYSKWIDNMKKIKFAGADGDVYFDAVGLRVPNASFLRIQNGKFIQ